MPLPHLDPHWQKYRNLDCQSIREGAIWILPMYGTKWTIQTKYVTFYFAIWGCREKYWSTLTLVLRFCTILLNVLELGWKNGGLSKPFVWQHQRVSFLIQSKLGSLAQKHGRSLKGVL